MWILLLEALGTGGLATFIVWWTWPRDDKDPSCNSD